MRLFRVPGKSQAHRDLIDQSPHTLQESQARILPLDRIIGEDKKGATATAAILLDEDERRLVKKGDDVTKEEMWELLENKRFDNLKSSAVNLQGD